MKWKNFQTKKMQKFGSLKKTPVFLRDSMKKQEKKRKKNRYIFLTGVPVFFFYEPQKLIQFVNNPPTKECICKSKRSSSNPANMRVNKNPRSDLEVAIVWSVLERDNLRGRIIKFLQKCRVVEFFPIENLWKSTKSPTFLWGNYWMTEPYS